MNNRSNNNRSNNTNNKKNNSNKNLSLDNLTLGKLIDELKNNQQFRNNVKEMFENTNSPLHKDFETLHERVNDLEKQLAEIREEIKQYHQNGGDLNTGVGGNLNGSLYPNQSSTTLNSTYPPNNLTQINSTLPNFTQQNNQNNHQSPVSANGNLQGTISPTLISQNNSNNSNNNTLSNISNNNQNDLSTISGQQNQTVIDNSELSPIGNNTQMSMNETTPLNSSLIFPTIQGTSQSFNTSSLPSFEAPTVPSSLSGVPSQNSTGGRKLNKRVVTRTVKPAKKPKNIKPKRKEIKKSKK